MRFIGIWVFWCCFQWANAQYYNPWIQNATTMPYPYQNALGMNSYPQNMPPYPFYGPPHFNPAYGGYPDMGYPPQPYYPQGFYGYPPVGGNFGAQQQPGFEQPQQPKPQQSLGTDNIKTEILDVSPEYQRQILGWPEEASSNNQVASKPRYTVDVDTQTSNVTSFPTNLTKPLVTEKKFTTSIRRTIVYDSSKPENIKPIDIHLVNGQQVTTAPPPTTTENEEVAVHPTRAKVKPSGRRFMDVPKSCPKGTLLAHNGQCMEPFLFREPSTNSTRV